MRDSDKELNVISILMLFNTLMREERSVCRDIYGEEERAEYLALRLSRFRVFAIRRKVTKFDVL